MSLSIVCLRRNLGPGKKLPASDNSGAAPGSNPGDDSSNQMVEEAKLCECAQRIQVAMERHSQGKRVKIRVENYDQGLGWYTSGSLTVPLNQLPLLEQAVQQMRTAERDDHEEYGKIIPFPNTLEAQPVERA